MELEWPTQNMYGFSSLPFFLLTFSHIGFIEQFHCTSTALVSGNKFFEKSLSLRKFIIHHGRVSSVLYFTVGKCRMPGSVHINSINLGKSWEGFVEDVMSKLRFKGI